MQVIDKHRLRCFGRKNLLERQHLNSATGKRTRETVQPAVVEARRAGHRRIEPRLDEKQYGHAMLASQRDAVTDGRFQTVYAPVLRFGWSGVGGQFARKQIAALRLAQGLGQPLPVYFLRFQFVELA